MRIKLCTSFAILCLMTSPAWAALAPFQFCINKNTDVIVNHGPTNCTGANQSLVHMDVAHNDKPLRPAAPGYGSVKKAILVVHDGSEGMPPAAYNQILSDITAAGLGSQTWLVAMNFRTASTAAGSSPLLWSTSGQHLGYAMGDTSVAPANVAVSSFALMDWLILRMKEVWATGITEFVIVGYGAGAEFVNRYSIGTSVEGNAILKPADPALAATVRYMMVRPDRYTYIAHDPAQLVPKRYEFPIPEKQTLAQPIPSINSNTGPYASCNDINDPGLYYDEYPYGTSLLAPGHYVAGTPAVIRERIKKKQRLFLVGKSEPAEASPACQDKLQGKDRRNRALIYAHHLRQENVAENAGLCVIQDIVGGSQINTPTEMLASHAARQYWQHNMVNCTLNDAPDDPLADNPFTVGEIDIDGDETGAGLATTLTAALPLCVQMEADAWDPIYYDREPAPSNKRIIHPAPACTGNNQAKVQLQYMSDCPPWPAGRNVSVYYEHYPGCPDPHDGSGGTPGVAKNLSLEGAWQPYDAVKKAVIVLSGSTGTPTDVFRQYTAELTNTTDKRETWVLAPQFAGKQTIAGAPANLLKWQRDGDVGVYALGGGSSSPNEATHPQQLHVQASAFDVMDHIIRVMKTKAPNLKEVTLIGFSRGGRYVNRYSIATDVESEFTDVSFRYVIGASGGHVYLDAERYYTLEDGGLNDPSEIGNNIFSFDKPKTPPPGTVRVNCSRAANGATLNRWPHGLDMSGIAGDHYVKQVIPSMSTEEISKWVGRKHRLFVVGEQDDNNRASDCEERLQGNDRRGRNFSYLHHLAVKGAATNTGFCVIKQAGHDRLKLLGSHAARSYWKSGMVDCSLDDEDEDSSSSSAQQARTKR